MPANLIREAIHLAKIFGRPVHITTTEPDHNGDQKWQTRSPSPGRPTVPENERIVKTYNPDGSQS